MIEYREAKLLGTPRYQTVELIVCAGCATILLSTQHTCATPGCEDQTATIVPYDISTQDILFAAEAERARTQ